MRQSSFFKASLIATVSTLILSTTAFADDLSITIYGQNRALVQDVRDLNFPSGTSKVDLPNVSSSINPATVTFQAAGISIVEQNFDFDLLTPDKLMEKAVGQTVTLVRTNPATGKETRQKAEVLAVNSGVVVEVDGRIEVLRDDDLPTRVIFDRVPKNLRAKPTLSVKVNSNKAGTRPATLTYLTNGLSWRADYVALFDEANGEMSFQGWATLTNGTDTTFDNAKTQLVAGDVNQNNQYDRYGNRRDTSRRNVRSGGTEAGNVERIGENYLYPLPGRTTIASNQTKQVGFVDAPTVKASKGYEYISYGMSSQSEAQNVDVRISFSNSKEGGLGAPLPRGTVRIYAEDQQGRAQFVGEDNIDHVPGGSDIAIKIGEAFDVTVQSTLKDRQTKGDYTTTTIEYRIKNARPSKEKVTIRQFVRSYIEKAKIIEENVKNRSNDVNSLVWDVDVPAEGERTLKVTVRERTSW